MNGLGRIIKLTAYNGSGSQISEYQYTDDIDASRVTLAKYLDGSTSDGDNVKLAYHTDGTLNSRTDQRRVVITFVYNDHRQVTYQDVTTLGGVYSAVRSIGCGYDNLARVEKVTSYDAISTGSPSAVNQVKFTYDNFHRVQKERAVTRRRG